MSQIYYNVDANGNITFSKSKPSSENDEFDPDNYMSKDEAIRFIEYLRKKEKPVLLVLFRLRILEPKAKGRILRNSWKE